MLKGKFFWALSVILVIAVLVTLNYKEQSLKIRPSYRTSSMKQLYMTHREDNKIKWVLKAKNATFPKGNKKILLDSLDLEINHSPVIYLTSGSGIYEIKKRNVTLKKPVELNIKGAKFTTTTMKWNSKHELITTDDAIKFRGENFLIEGTGLYSRVKQKKVKILNNVKAIFYR
jgi:LPS export ABC transporter protein LptC